MNAQAETRNNTLFVIVNVTLPLCGKRLIWKVCTVLAQNININSEQLTDFLSKEILNNIKKK